MADTLNLVFMGTAPLAAKSLQALAESPSYRVLAVVTQPDKPAGRDLKVQFSAVKDQALKHQLPVLQPARARDEAFLQQLRQLAPDLIVVAAYGQILPQSLLDLPRHGCLNVHASLLPKYRGAAPIQWAILDGEAETGVTIMKMDAGLDTGPMVAKAVVPIRPNDTGGTLHDKLAIVGARLLLETIPPYVSGQLTPQPQPAEGATYARKIAKADGLIDWKRPSSTIALGVRGLNPWPGAFSELQTAAGTQMIKIWKAEPRQEGKGAPGEILAATNGQLTIACGEGSLEVLELQREGRRRLPAPEFLAGCALTAADRFGPAAG